MVKDIELINDRPIHTYDFGITLDENNIEVYIPLYINFLKRIGMNQEVIIEAINTYLERVSLEKKSKIMEVVTLSLIENIDGESETID